MSRPVLSSVSVLCSQLHYRYILCQAENKGPLIVSEFTGVSSQLSKAIKVNPWDLGGVARAIDTCLKMPYEEREMRHSVSLRCKSR